MKIIIELDEELKKPIDEMDEEVLDEAKQQLPRKTVKLPKDEGMIEPGQNAKHVVHVVKKGETLKLISEKYGVSYGELSNHLMNTEGTTNIHEGMEIEIPRCFIDMSEAK
jgi:hypothetical protein